MRAIEDIDPQRRATNGQQITVAYKQACLFAEVLRARVNFLSVKVSAVHTSQVPDLKGRRIDVQLAMVTGNELIPFRSGQLDKTIQSPPRLTPSRSTKAEPVVLVWPRKHREPDGGNHLRLLRKSSNR
jgi:hypothetical protein